MILMVLFVIFDVVKTECPIGVYKFVNITHLLEYPELRQTTADSVRNCGAECTGTPGCMSFAYQETTLECYLYGIRVWYGMGNKVGNQSSVPFIHYWKTEDGCSGTKVYTASENLCFGIYQSETKPWIEARVFCEEKGGVLYMADTSSKKSILISTLDSKGIYGIVCVGTTAEQHPYTWNWFNGVEVINWAIGEPAVNTIGQKCGMLQRQHLFNERCIDPCIPVCEFPTAPNAR